MKTCLKSLSLLSLSALILMSCGKGGDEAPIGPVNPLPAPAPVDVKVPGTSCDLLAGGTSLASTPFVGRLTPLQRVSNQWLTQLSSLTLSASVLTSVGYTTQTNNLIASGQITLSELSSWYQNNTLPTACLQSPTTSANSATGYFINGQVRSLVLTGSISVPLYSPFSWNGYPTGAPGTSPTLGQQLIQVIVGSNCTTSFVPSYGNASGRIRGCLSVRLGNQPNSQILNYQSQ